MYYIRFLNITNPLKDVEKMYNNGEVKKGDIVFLQYSKNYCKCFFNGTWLKSIYNSKIKGGNEIEDDINILSTSIIDISNSLTDVSSRLYNDYLTKTQYLKDELLIASSFADLNNKINNIDISDLLKDIKKNILTLNKDVFDVSLSLYTLTDTEDINNTIDTFKEVENFLNNISDSSTLTELLLNTKNDIIDGISEYYYNIEEIDNKVENINTSINDSSNRIKELEKLYNNTLIDTFISNLNSSILCVSNNLNNTSINLNDTSNRLYNTSINLNDISTRLYNVSNNLNDTSIKLTDISINLNDVSTRLFIDYLTKNQYLKDEELVCSTFAELNNKINNNINIINSSINDIKNNILNIDFDSLKEEISNNVAKEYATKLNVNDIANKIWNKTAETYISINLYTKDEELICSTFGEINNKINENVTIFNNSINNIKNDIQNIDFDSLKEEISNEYIKKLDVIDITDNINSSINNSSNRITKLEKLYNNDKIDSFISNLNSSILNVSNNLNNTSIRLNDVSTRLFTDYLTKNQYLKDELLIASSFADLNNKINNIDITLQLIPINNNIYNLKTKTNNIEVTLNNLIGTEQDDVNNTIDTFKEVEKFLNNISDSSSLTELLLTTKNDINNNVTETLKNYYTKDIIDNVSINTTTRLNDVSVNLNDTSTRLNDVSVNLNDTSTRLNDVSVNLNDTSTRLLNYLTIKQYIKDEELVSTTFSIINNTINKNQENITNIINSSFNDIYKRYLTIDLYLKDETLIASAFNELNNKINSLQEELNELKTKTN